MMDIDDVKVLADVAFNDNVTKALKKSYEDAIDVQYGVYNTGPYEGCLTINLKPTKGITDWMYNLLALPKKTSHGKVMAGYQKELEKYWNAIITDIIWVHKKFSLLLSNGFILAGRSKGAAEALLMIPRLSDFGQVRLCGAFEPPKVCDRKYAEYLDTFCQNILITSYRNDIVTGIPPWFEHPAQVIQIGKRRLGLSIKDHQNATTDKKIILGGWEETL